MVGVGDLLEVTSCATVDYIGYPAPDAFTTEGTWTLTGFPTYGGCWFNFEASYDH